MIRAKLTYANVMATIALFVALGGGAVAATKNSATSAKKVKIGTKQLKNGSVTIDKLAAGAVTTPKLADDSVSAGKLQAGAVGARQLALIQVAQNSGTTGATAGCPQGTRLLSGGAFSLNGSLYATAPSLDPVVSIWQASAQGATATTAYALCLSAAN